MRPSSRDLPGLVYEKTYQKYRSPLLTSEDKMGEVVCPELIEAYPEPVKEPRANGEEPQKASPVRAEPFDCAQDRLRASEVEA
jgi:hypothetical protein